MLRAEENWNEATAIFAEIISHAGAIGNVEFNHCGRDLNKAAHVIARECFLLKSLVIGLMNPLILFCKLS